MAAGSSLSHISVNGRVSVTPTPSTPSTPRRGRVQKFFAVSVLKDEVDDILDDDNNNADREVFTSM